MSQPQQSRGRFHTIPGAVGMPTTPGWLPLTKAFHAQQLPCPVNPLCSHSCWFEMVLWNISSLAQPLLLLLLCLVSLLGHCTLPVWFVTEGLSLLASFWLLGGSHWALGTSRAD